MNHYEPLISYLKWVVKIGYSNQVGWLIGTVKLDVNTMVNRLSHLWSVSFSWLEPYPNHPQMAMDSIGHLSGWLAPSPNINHSPYFYHPFSWEWSTDHPKKWWFFLGDGEKIDRPGMIFFIPYSLNSELTVVEELSTHRSICWGSFPKTMLDISVHVAVLCQDNAKMGKLGYNSKIFMMRDRKNAMSFNETLATKIRSARATIMQVRLSLPRVEVELKAELFEHQLHS